LLGVSAVAVNKRCRRGRLPFVEKAGRRWFRRDHLELVKHADLVKRPGTESQAFRQAGSHEGADLQTPPPAARNLVDERKR
jgi:hypothetical protein